MLVTQFPTHDFDIFHLHFKFSNKASRKYALIKFHFNILNFSTNNKSLQSDNNWLITGFYWNSVKVPIFSKTYCLRLGSLKKVKPETSTCYDSLFGEVIPQGTGILEKSNREGSCFNQGSPEKQNLSITYLSIHQEIYFKELAHTIWGLASLKITGQANSLETQVGVDAAVLRPNFFFFGKPRFLLSRSFNWLEEVDPQLPMYLAPRNVMVIAINSYKSRVHWLPSKFCYPLY